MQSLNPNTMPLAEVVRTYEDRHGVSVARVGKTATQLGFMDRLEADLRAALTAGRPIPGWESYVVNTLTAIKGEGGHDAGWTPYAGQSHGESIGRE